MRIQGIPAEREFSDNLSSIMVLGMSTDSLRVEIEYGYSVIYSQTLTAYDDGVTKYVEINIGDLLEPYSKEYVSFPLKVTLRDGAIEEVINCWVFHHDGDMLKTFSEWCGNYFLSKATTKRITPQREETLYFPYGGPSMRIESVVARVYYDDDTTFDYPLAINNNTFQNIRYVKFKPNDFWRLGKDIYRIVVTMTTEVLDENQNVKELRYATMEYLTDYEHIGSEGPVFIYQNAFGVPEKFYATGNTEFTPDIQRDSAVINGVYKNYRQRITKQWKVDTGILTPEEAECLLEMFYSPHIMQCNINQYGEYTPWKEIAIVKSDIKHTDDDDTLIRYSFTYRNAEKRVTPKSGQEYPYIFREEYQTMFE